MDSKFEANVRMVSSQGRPTKKFVPLTAVDEKKTA